MIVTIVIDAKQIDMTFRREDASLILGLQVRSQMSWIHTLEYLHLVEICAFCIQLFSQPMLSLEEVDGVGVSSPSNLEACQRWHNQTFSKPYLIMYITAGCTIYVSQRTM